MDLTRIVVIDVGNSAAKIGAAKGEDVAGPVRLPRADGRAVRDVATRMLGGQQAVIAITGSDPDKAQGLAWEVKKLRLGTVVVVDPSHKGVPAAQVDQPGRAGMDRRVQALAAAHLAQGPAAVVSCGTAITVDVVAEGGALLGGAILPGLGLGARALAQGTAKLPEVALAGEVQMPGKDTEKAIRAGLILGAAGAVDRLLAEADLNEATPVFLTGQDAPHLVEPLTRSARVAPGLGILGAALAVRAHPPRR